MESQESIDNKYLILENKGSGASAIVYLVKELNGEKTYAGKVLRESSELFDKEIEILNTLKSLNNPYLVNLIDNGNGPIVRASKPTETKQYLVLEYAKKGELFNYIFFAHEGLPEKYSKVIFSKILQGVQACHNAGICHRDLKMQNMLLDENFNPKICDFGFATMNTGKLNEFLGTLNYAAPEILQHKPYDGFKADIFSLGVVLMTLVTCKMGFNEATKKDPLYRLVITKHFGQYWNIVSELAKINDLSDNFKKLYNRMISYRAQERPTIEEIFDSEWMKEIKDLSKDEMSKLENEIRKEFLRRETIVNEGSKKKVKVKEEYSTDMSSATRGGDDEDINYFDLSLKPKYAQTGIGMKNYIKLEGELNPVRYMNNLCKLISKRIENCSIEENKNVLKFNVTFEEQEKEEEEIPKELEEELAKLGLGENENEENEEVEDNLEKKESIIQVKIYESINGGHILKFSKKSGEIEDYYKNLEKITKLIEKQA